MSKYQMIHTADDVVQAMEIDNIELATKIADLANTLICQPNVHVKVQDEAVVDNVLLYLAHHEIWAYAREPCDTSRGPSGFEVLAKC